MLPRLQFRFSFVPLPLVYHLAAVFTEPLSKPVYRPYPLSSAFSSLCTQPLTIVMKQYHSLFRFQTSLVSDTLRRSTFLACHSERTLPSRSSRMGQRRGGNAMRSVHLASSVTTAR